MEKLKHSSIYLLALQRILRLQNILSYPSSKINRWKVLQVILQGSRNEKEDHSNDFIKFDSDLTRQECKDIVRKSLAVAKRAEVSSMWGCECSEIHFSTRKDSDKVSRM